MEENSNEVLTVQYEANSKFQSKLTMLLGLAFVPEQDVPDCIINLMTEFTEQALCCTVF